MKMRRLNGHKNNEKQDRTSKILLLLYVLFLPLSVILIGQIIYLKFIWEPDPEIVQYVRPYEKQETITAIRGTITDCEDRPLSISIPLYEIRMDCTVQKANYKMNKENGIEYEQKWRKKAHELSKGLAKILKDKSASEYARLILNGRERNRKYVLIAKNVKFETLAELKKLPLFNEGPYKGGIIVETNYDNRQYPYGGLAKQIIGEPGNKKGIEHTFDKTLRGKNGSVWKRIIDNKDKVVDNDSTIIPVHHGKDIKTTLNINMQDIADRALRNQIAETDEISGACMILMEVKTGAIKAMVNLSRNSRGQFEENVNHALTKSGEPGSVIKAASLMALLEDDKVRLSTTMPTNGGRIPNVTIWNSDHYITRYEQKEQKKEITILKGFQLSSNYVLGRAVKEAYGDNPNEFIEKLEGFHLGGSIPFELGCVPSTLPKKGKEGRSNNSMLVSAAVGYSTMFTPLHLVTFYNAIARGGEMVRPYLVQAFENGETTVKEFKPQVIGRICSESTADSLRYALGKVVSEGTGSKLKNAKNSVAGKTGTAWIAFDKDNRANRSHAYINKKGEKQYRATFVGFFPEEKPLYSVICVIYSKPFKGTLYGGNKPAKAINEVIEKLYALNERWGTTIRENGEIPSMDLSYMPVANIDNTVPDVKGMSLDDALYTLENSGYRCHYSGMGHVYAQTPASGTRLYKGQTVKIDLK